MNFHEIKLFNLIKDWDRVNPLTQIFLVSLVVLFIGSLLSLKLLVLTSILVVLIYSLYTYIWIKQKLG